MVTKLANVSFAIFSIKPVQIKQLNLPFCVFSMLTTSLNYSKANIGEERQHHQRLTAAKEALSRLKYLALAAAVKMDGASAIRGRV